MLPLPIPDNPRDCFYSCIHLKDAREAQPIRSAKTPHCQFVTARIGNA
jgi:hypothetical protein